MIILIIDDEEEMLVMMKGFLEKRGYTVITSSSPKKGIELAAQNHPDLIIIDIAMPEMSGYETCSILRSAKETAETPILIVTGKELTPEGISKRCGELAIDDFMYKPISVKSLLEKINTLFKQSHLG